MTAVIPVIEPDPFDVRRAQGAAGLLAEFNLAGVLTSADIHVAGRLGGLLAEEDETVLLAAALAVRAPRVGHVCTDLATVRDTVTSDPEPGGWAELLDPQGLPWPAADPWLAALAASPLVAAGAGWDGAATAADNRPLRLVGTRLYLDRYWREERDVAVDLLSRGRGRADGVDLDILAGGLARLFVGEGSREQRVAAATAVLRRLTVIAGGPGTGKTTTVARILALLDEQAAGTGALPRVALAAPTGKAAARLEEAVHAEAARLDVADAVRRRLLALEASTLHRLLGWRPGSRSRFRHDRGNRLPHDVVVVDETSMVSLSLMAKLVEAVRTGARLVLVGDPEQLASVEAGAVMGDIVGPASDGLRMRPAARAVLGAVTGDEPPGIAPAEGAAIGDGIAVLRHVHRYGGGIAELAEAVRRGDAAEAVAVLRAERDDVAWIDADVAQADPSRAMAPVRQAVVAAGRRVAEHARAGDGLAALDGLGAMRVLCAHRRGPYGAASWARHVERWLSAAIAGYATGGRWYTGRPLLVTANDYGLRLYNGDTGVVIVTDDGRATAVFERRGELVEVSPARLGAVETVHAMTIHKSQGSQFDDVAVVLPDPSSPILTRELLYTAVSRARSRLTVVGSADSVRAAVERPIARASGLRAQLWAT
ncbi:MAG: exodeoxyribonuclease V subunit alpha [Euzebyales bacterium]|nr:exodeoxyribonuclease V subunit alpha [Euzebyales bacterium]